MAGDPTDEGRLVPTLRDRAPRQPGRTGADDKADGVEDDLGARLDAISQRLPEIEAAFDVDDPRSSARCRYTQ
jgi:hypothetical protein